MNSDELKIILDRLTVLQDGLDRIDRDMAKDRENDENMALRVGALETIVEAMNKKLSNQVDRIGDKVEDAVAPMMREAKDLKKTIASKKVMVIKEKTRGFWRRLFRR